MARKLFDTETGNYGTDYLNRALVTAVGLGANRGKDAVYPMSPKDTYGRAYDGSNNYVIRFSRVNCRLSGDFGP